MTTIHARQTQLTKMRIRKTKKAEKASVYGCKITQRLKSLSHGIVSWPIFEPWT